MRVISCMIVLVLLCTTFTGCSLFKKNTNSTPGPGGAVGPAPAKFPGEKDPLFNSNIPTPPAFPPAAAPPMTPMSGKGQTTILAGTVTDAFQRPMGNAYIRWVSLDPKDVGAPIDVAADARGHFIIQGVKTGAEYKLIARTKQGDKMLAGTVLTSAPNVRVVITIREDLVNANTPPLPGSPAYKGEPGGGVSKNTNVEPNLPATLTVPAPPVNTPVGNPPPKTAHPAFVPNVAANPKDRLPMLNLPGKPTNPTIPIDPPLGAPTPILRPGDAKLDYAPARVPSCVLIGNHLENLALKDAKGQTWEYRKQGAGKLVLIEFWGTTCVYCRDIMPALNRLHQQYATRGLEVIGIAIERGADERKEAEAVNKLCTSMHLSYRQLMGRSGTFDAGKHFKIEGLPTMMLLTEQGDIIWHHVGRPDPALLSALERTIQSRLNNRPF